MTEKKILDDLARAKFGDMYASEDFDHPRARAMREEVAFAVPVVQEAENAFPTMPKGMGKTWEVEFAEAQMRRADREADEIRDRLRAEHGDSFDPMRDVDFVKARLSYYHAYADWLQERANAIARAGRSLAQKELGRAYGRAGETIRLLKLELAVARGGKDRKDEYLGELVNLERKAEREYQTREYYRVSYDRELAESRRLRDLLSQVRRAAKASGNEDILQILEAES